MILIPRNNFIVFIFLLGGLNSAVAQLDNFIFKRQTDITYAQSEFNFGQSDTAINEDDSSNNQNLYIPKSEKKEIRVYRSGFSFGNLMYCKNNEYGENNNPGQTFFGNQLWFGGKSYFTQNLSGSIGLLLQYDYGDNKFPSKTLPIFNIEYKTNKSHLIAGTILGNANHYLIEPVYNYENVFTKPLEYGLQYYTQNKLFSYQTWLDWRQFAKIATSQQEIISFGQTINIHLIDSSKYPVAISLPSSLLVYHQGGEALNIPQRIQTSINATFGIRLSDKSKHLRAESFYLISNDPSPTLNHAFKNGQGSMTNLTYFFYQKDFSQHRIVATYYKAVEFYSPLGATLFASELQGKPYFQSRVREFVMLRYQFEKVFYLPNMSDFKFDIRVEPIYHIEQKLFAFSTGIYLKYLIGNRIN
jgi:hypothetical protein